METNNEKGFVKFQMTITFSKIMAFVLSWQAVYIDLTIVKNGTIFMFVLPFVVFLITGKQAIDWKKETTKTPDKQ
jgi:uncharacterized Tic20 family protein